MSLYGCMLEGATSRGDIDPREYVEENNGQLAYVIKHSNDQFVRGLCLAALVKYGDEETEIEDIKKELEQLREMETL